MMNFFITVISLLIVIKMADIFVDQATALSKKLKLSGFIVGFLIVSLGTTLPELSTSIYSTLIGHKDIAISNIIGSNIANIFFVLGLLAISSKFKLQKIDINFNIPLLLAITFATVIVLFINNLFFSSTLGIIFLCVFLVSTYLIYRNNHIEVVESKVKFNIFFLLGAVLVLFVFSKICIDSILSLATDLKIPEVLTGYFLLAIGTSLPELATLHSSLKKGREDIGLGNIIGSNMFNLLFLPGVISLISPMNLSAFKVEYIFVLLATVTLFVFGYMGKKYYFSKKEGFILISFYILFALVQILRNIF